MTEPLFIDVREPIEYADGHLIGAVNIPPSALVAGAKGLEKYPKDTPLVLYCHSGSRSNVAIGILQQLGYTNLTNGVNQRQAEQLWQRKQLMK